MRADPNVKMAEAKAQSVATWSGTELVCAAVHQGQHTELCGHDHAPVTRGRSLVSVASWPRKTVTWRPSPPPPRETGRLSECLFFFGVFLSMLARAAGP